MNIVSDFAEGRLHHPLNKNPVCIVSDFAEGRPHRPLNRNPICQCE